MSPEASKVREGMPVLAMDGSFLGRVFAVSSRSLALEAGTFLPREWRTSLEEVVRVDDRGVWLAHGRGALERISDAFAGPADPYKAAADASPIHQWSGFDPPAVAPPEPGRPGPDGREVQPTSDGGGPMVH